MPRKYTRKTLRINLGDENFGAVLNCAVRYAMGRRTYMPGLVIDFITPLLPQLDNKTLWCFDQDVTEAKWCGGYGDPYIDEPHWRAFHEAVRAERTRRGHELYRSWREPNVSAQTMAAIEKIGRKAHGEEAE